MKYLDTWRIILNSLSRVGLVITGLVYPINKPLTKWGDPPSRNPTAATWQWRYQGIEVSSPSYIYKSPKTCLVEPRKKPSDTFHQILVCLIGILVVVYYHSNHLKNISQNGNLPQIEVKMKNIWNHHLDNWMAFHPLYTLKQAHGARTFHCLNSIHPKKSHHRSPKHSTHGNQKWKILDSNTGAL